MWCEGVDWIDVAAYRV